MMPVWSFITNCEFSGVLPAVKGSTAKIRALSLVALRIQLCLLPLLSTCPRVALVAVAPYLVKTPSNGRWSKCPLISPLTHSIPLPPPPNFELTLLFPAYSLILVIIAVDSVHNVLSNDRRGTLMLHVYLLQYAYFMTACKGAFMALNFHSSLDPPS
jgi:hypothetical protein